MKEEWHTRRDNANCPNGVRDVVVWRLYSVLARAVGVEETLRDSTHLDAKLNTFRYIVSEFKRCNERKRKEEKLSGCVWEEACAHKRCCRLFFLSTSIFSKLTRPFKIIF